MIRRILRFLFGPAFSGEGLPLSLLIRCAFHQKILMNNRQVRWPVHWTSKITSPHKIHRGSRYPGLSMGCHIDGRNGIRFGNNVWIGPKCTIISMNHNVQDFENFIQEGPIVIGDNSWLGANATILPNVNLGEHTIVAAGAVVTKSFLQGNIVLAGIPAKIVKHLPPYGQMIENENSDGSK
ncbi:MAG: acyltransferase [Sulfitobacter sp.]|uniref:acyltransferase n=1 Tax=Celeribacter marinus TaxID=1397108 RepID=UPI0031772597